MTSDPVNVNDADDLEGYEYFHPVHVLGFWLNELLDLVLRPRFLKPPPNGVALSKDEDSARYGPIDSSDDWKPWGERHAMALKAAEHALDATMGVNRWLRYGLDKRAGKLETGLRQSLPEVVHFLERTSDSEQFRKEHRLFLNIIGPVHDAHRELCTAAIDPDDGALEEWFKYIGTMRSKLADVLDCHRLLCQILLRQPRGRVGDLLYRFLVAMCDYENVLPLVECQFRRGYRGDEEFERAFNVVRLFVPARDSFQQILGIWERPAEPDPPETHEKFRTEADRIRRKLEETLLARPHPDQPQALWTLGINAPTTIRPVWDANLRELRFGDVVCKRFKRTAKNQEAVLSAFQEDSWSPRIDSPVLADKLHETIHALNESLVGLRFSADGSGQGIRWGRA